MQTFIHSKYIPESKTDAPQAEATRNCKTDWSLILEPQKESTTEHVLDEHNYSYNCDNEQITKPTPYTLRYNASARGPCTKTLYNRTRYQRTKGRRIPSFTQCHASVSASHLRYGMQGKHNHSFPFHEKHQEDKHFSNNKYSILDKIKDYFDKSHKKCKDFNEDCMSVQSFDGTLTTY